MKAFAFALIFALAPSLALAFDHGVGAGLGPLPTVSSVTPTRIGTAGQTGMTINGTNLAGALSVNFGSSAATGCTVVSSSQILCTAPAEGAGTVHTTVSTIAGVSAATTADQVVYSAPTWTQSLNFCPGGSGPTPICTTGPTGYSGAVWGNEMRQLAALNPYTSSAALYAADALTGDSTSINSQVLKLTAPESAGGTWAIDLNFNTACAAIFTSGFPCFKDVDVLQTVSFTVDANGAANNATILVVSSSTGSTNSGCASPNYLTFSFERNPTDNDWYYDQLSCLPKLGGQGTNEVRAYSWVAHTDSVTGQQYAFVGAEGTGILAGQLNPNYATAGQEAILWGCSPYNGAYPGCAAAGATPYTSGCASCIVPEFLTSTYASGPGSPNVPACSSSGGISLVRVMGFAEVKGADGVSRAYAIVCFGVFVRIDGPTPGADSCGPQQVDVNHNCVARWQPVYYLPAAQIYATESGFRALTALTEDNPQDMIVGSDASSSATTSAYWRIPALCPSANAGCGSYQGNSPGDSCADYSATTGLITMNSVTANGCGTNEGYFYNLFYAATGMTDGGQADTAYNDFRLFYNAADQPARYIAISTAVSAPIQPTNPYTYAAHNGVWLAEAAHMIRAQNATYTVVIEPDLFPYPQVATRSIVPSPFKQECAFDGTRYYNCDVYAGGWDILGAVNNEYFWCYNTAAPPAGVPCLSSTSTHSITASIAGNALTVSAGTPAIGDVLTQSGGTAIAAQTTIMSGSNPTWTLSGAPQTVPSEAMTAAAPTQVSSTNTAWISHYGP